MTKPQTLRSAIIGSLLVVSPWASSTPGELPTVSKTAELTPLHASSLKELAGRVIELSPLVRAAGASFDAAQARVTAASQPLYNPELELGWEESDVRTATIGISQTIDWSDKRDARTQVTAFQRQASAEELAQIRQEVAANLLAGLASYQTKLELNELAQQGRELTERFLSLASNRYEAGDLTQTDLDLARLSAMAARLQQVQAQTDLADAQQALIEAAGISQPSWPSLPDQLPNLPAEQLGENTLAERLPVLRVLMAQVRAAEANVLLLNRERRPDPTLGVSGGREGSENVVGLTFSVPLFVRNSFSAEVEVANADLIELESQTQDAMRRARARLSSATQRYRITQDAWRDWQKTGYTSLSRQTELLRRLWEAGELSSSEYLVQLKQSLDTQAEAFSLRGSLWQAWVDWLAASGQIESWLLGNERTNPADRRSANSGELTQ